MARQAVRLYESIKGQKPSKKEITTHFIAGQKVRGVALDESHGKPWGVHEVSTTSSTSVEQRGELASTADCTEETVQAAWANGQKRARTSSAQGKLNDAGATGAVTLKSVLAADSQEVDDEDDDAVMDDIWGKRMNFHNRSAKKKKRKSVGSGDTDPESDGGVSVQATTKKKKATKAAAVVTPKADRARPSGAGSAGAAGSPAPSPSPEGQREAPKPAVATLSARQINLELDRADQVVLALKQFCSNIQDSNMIRSLTVKSHTALMEKLKLRLADDKLKIYTADYSGVSTTRGMSILDELQKHKASMEIIGTVIASLQAQDGDAATAQGLGTALDAAKVAKIPIAPWATEMLVVRGLQEAFTSKDFDAYAKRLPADSSDPYGVSLLSKADAKELQQNNVARAIVSICRATGETPVLDEAAARLKKFLSLVSTAKLLSDDFTTEIDRLAKVLEVSVDMPASELAELESMKNELLANKTGPFYKALTILPAGSHAMGMVSSVFDQHARDRTFETELKAMEPTAESLRRATPDSCWRNDALHVPAADRWADLNKKMANIQANSSKPFQEANAESINKIRARQSELKGALLAAARSAFSTAFTECADAVVAALKAPGEQGPMTTAISNLASAIPKTLDGPVPKCLPKSDYDDLCHAFTSMGNFAAALEAAAPLVGALAADQHVDLMGDNVSKALAALHDKETLSEIFGEPEEGDLGESDEDSGPAQQLQREFAQCVCEAAKKAIVAMVCSCEAFVKELDDEDGEVESLFNTQLVGAPPDTASSDEGNRNVMLSVRVFELCKRYLEDAEGAAVPLGDGECQLESVCSATPLLSFVQVVVQLCAMSDKGFESTVACQSSMTSFVKACEYGSAASKHLSELLGTDNSDHKLQKVLRTGLEK